VPSGISKYETIKAQYSLGAGLTFIQMLNAAYNVYPTYATTPELQPTTISISRGNTTPMITLLETSTTAGRHILFKNSILLTTQFYIGYNSGAFLVYSETSAGVFSGGTYLPNTSGLWVNNSDERLKHDIVVLTNNLDKIMKVRAVSFKYNYQGTDATNNLGFIAQDWLKVQPEVVTISPNTNPDDTTEYYGLAYSSTIPVLTGAVQELNLKVIEQQKTIDLLLERLERLETLNCIN
jgi:hypothetical protein